MATLSVGPTGTDEVLFARRGDVGHIRLNRPRPINSLTIEMVTAISERLTAWADDDAVASVFLDGAGERGLCAGGDVLRMRQLAIDSGDSSAFLLAEYDMNTQIATYPKPYVAMMSGITMGGGLGISTHGSLRLVTADAKIAMPETMIGFFPDVGVRWQLAHAPGELGMWLGLTGRTVDAAAAVAVGLADVALAGANDDASEFLANREWVDECFAGDDPVAMCERLRTSEYPAAREAAAEIAARSPWSVWATTLAIRAAERADSVVEVLAADKRIGPALSAHPDLVEGIGAKMVDRRAPKWTHRELESVDRGEVEAIING